MSGAEPIEPEFIVGPAYMGPTGDGRETLTVDVLIVWSDEEVAR